MIADDLARHVSTDYWTYDVTRSSLRVGSGGYNVPAFGGVARFDIMRLAANCRAGILESMLEGCYLFWFVKDTLEPIYYDTRKNFWFIVSGLPSFKDGLEAAYICSRTEPMFEVESDLRNGRMYVDRLESTGWETRKYVGYEDYDYFDNSMTMPVFRVTGTGEVDRGISEKYFRWRSDETPNPSEQSKRSFMRGAFNLEENGV